MITLANLLLKVLDNQQEYQKITTILTETYLQESSATEIDDLLQVVIKDAKEAQSWPARSEGYLYAKRIKDEMEQHPRLQVFLHEDHQEQPASHYEVKQLLDYPVRDFATDPSWVADFLWDILFGVNDEDDTHQEVDLTNDFDDYQARTGNITVEDHTYNDDLEDGGSAKYVDFEANDNLDYED